MAVAEHNLIDDAVHEVAQSIEGTKHAYDRLLTLIGEATHAAEITKRVIKEKGFTAVGASE